MTVYTPQLFFNSIMTFLFYWSVAGWPCCVSFRYTAKGFSYAAAKSLQSCPTLCDPTDGQPTRLPIPGILQARVLERDAIAFSVAMHISVYMSMYIFIFLLQILFPYRSLQNIEYISLCYTVGFLSVLYTAVCICQFPPPNLPIPLLHPPLVTICLLSMSVPKLFKPLPQSPTLATPTSHITLRSLHSPSSASTWKDRPQTRLQHRLNVQLHRC